MRRPQSQPALAAIQSPPQVKLAPLNDPVRREEARRRVRQALMEQAGGSAAAAFRKMNSNRTGRICHVDFADSVTRMGVNWQGLTGLFMARDLFALFDQQKHFVITFEDLFPGEDPADKARPSTPVFCREYARSGNYDEKPARWDPSDQEEVLRIARMMSDSGDEATEKRKWMRSTMRRLKTKGKSDARCREVVAAHLPRGSGPKDRDGVNLFTRQDLKGCKKVYTDNINLPMRRMWKEVLSYKDQKKEQRRVYERLFTVTEGATQKKLESVNLLMSCNLFSGVKKPDEAMGAMGGNERQPSKRNKSKESVNFAAAPPPDDPAAAKAFQRLAQKGILKKAGFEQIMKVLVPDMDSASVNSHWTEVLGILQQSADLQGQYCDKTSQMLNSLEAHISSGDCINYEAFRSWWHARTNE